MVKSKPEPVKRPLSLEQRPSEEKIIEKLFSKSEYSYCLLLKNSFKPLLYKDRNFNLFIGLYDKQRNIVLNSKSVSVKIAVYSSSDDLEQIYSNKQNQPIMKGNTVVDLTQGHASFQKLSIREVTSKFDRGLVHLIISVEAPPFDSEDFDYREIRPLIIKDVMVRAKKQT